MTRLSAAAAGYVNQFGWRVFPLKPKDKVPFGRLAPHGVLDASNDIKQVQEWWRAEPNANIGLACGYGWFVVDVDVRNNGDETFGRLEAAYGALPETPRQVTGGGGFHVLLSMPDSYKLKGSLGEGVDIKSRGGYIVAAPSIHPNGKMYFWEAVAHPTEVPVADAPQWVLDALAIRPSQYTGEQVGDAASCFLARCFDVAGWLGVSIGNSKVIARCPWVMSHSTDHDGHRTGGGEDSSCVILAPTEQRPLGTFYCAHGHCTEAGRGNVDALCALPTSAVCVIAEQMPEHFETAINLLAAKVRTC